MKSKPNLAIAAKVRTVFRNHILNLKNWRQCDMKRMTMCVRLEIKTSTKKPQKEDLPMKRTIKNFIKISRQ